MGNDKIKKRQTPRKSTGGKAQRKQLFPEKVPPTPEYLFYLRYRGDIPHATDNGNSRGTQSYPSVSDVQVQNAPDLVDKATNTPIRNLPPCCKCCCAKSESEDSSEEV